MITHLNRTGLLYSLRNRLRSSLSDRHSVSLISQDTPGDIRHGSGISNVLIVKNKTVNMQQTQ